MSLHNDVSLTLRTAASGPAGNWHAWLALAGMLATFAGMVAMMWFLSSAPTLDLTGWLCGAASAAGLFLWRATLPRAVERARR
jgi:hypothetical protein